MKPSADQVEKRVLAVILLLGISQFIGARLAAQSSNADLVLSFSNSPAMVSLGQYFTVSIDVFNWGPDPASNLVVTNLLPFNATFIGASASQGSVTLSNGVVTCAFGSLPFYRGVALTIELKADTIASLTNFASVSSGTPDPVSTNNQLALVTGVTQARFYASGRTHTGYYMPTVTVMTNNKALIVGAPLVKTADVYNAATRLCELPGSLLGLRSYHTATLLTNGLVLIAGGYYYSPNSAEVYDPGTMLFNAVGNLIYDRWGHTATLLPDGRVLICGGTGGTANEVYNPGTQTFSLADPGLQCAPGGVLLPNGKYLQVGWHDASLYDPSTGITTPTGAPILSRGYFTATLIPGAGKVLVAGGQIFDGPTSTDAAELYDIATGTFSLTASMTTPRREHGAAGLPDGTVLLAGGYTSYADTSDLDRTEIFDINGAPSVPGVGVSDTSVIEGNSGSNYLNFNLWLTTTSSLPVTVQYGATAGTAASYVWGVGTPDFVPISGVLTFPPGSTNQVLQVPVLGDTILEPDETVYMNLSLPTQAWIARASATGTILNDDSAPAVSITPASAPEGDSGLSNMTFYVSLSSPCISPVMVDYFTADQTAQAGTDYVFTAGTLTFNPGDTNLPIAVPVIGDLTPEPNETLMLNLSNAQNAVLIVSNAVGTIIDDDGVAGQLHHFDWSAIASPQTQTFGFPVTITARDYAGGVATNLPWPVRVYARTTNVIAHNLDFERPSLAPWVPFNDTPYDKPFQQVQYNVAGFGQSSTAFRTIAGGGTNGIGENIFLAGGITYTFSVNLVASMEAYDMSCLGGAFYLQVGPTNAAWGLPDLCGGYARNTVTLVYTPPTNGIYRLQLVIARDYYYGDAYAVYADDVQISYPVVTPTLVTNFTNGVWSGSVAALQSATNVTLVADDGAGHKGTSNPFNIQPATDLGLSGSAIWVPSLRTGDRLTFNIAVTNREPAAVLDAVVQSVLPTNLTFLSATNQQGIATNSAGVFQWTLGPLARGSNIMCSVVTRADVAGTITNLFTLSSSILEINPGDNTLAFTNLIWPPVLSISPASGIEAAASATGMVFALTLSGGTAEPVSADYFTIDGSAVAGVDYAATNGTITFPPFATNASIRVYAIDNILDQPDRTFGVGLANFVNTDPYDDIPAAGTILDDDPPPVIWIYDTAVVEGDSGTTNAVFRLTLSKPAIQDVTVSFSSMDGTATLANNDYVSTSGNVVFAAGTTNQTLSVPVVGNTVNEPDETFFVNISSGSGATFGTNRAACTIINDDAVAGRLDHFLFEPVASPQCTNRPFPISLHAVDYLGNTVHSFAGPATLVAQSDQFLTEWMSDDFEDGDLNGWTNYFAPQLLSSNVSDTAGAGVRSLKLTGRAPQPPFTYGLRRQITNCHPTEISFYVRAGQTNVNCGRLDAIGGAGYAAVDFYMNSKGLMGLASGNMQPSIPYQSNQWYKVDLELNWTTLRVNCRINGALLVTNVPFLNTPYPGINYIILQNSDSGTSWFDEIKAFELSRTNLLVFPSNLVGFMSGVWSNSVTVARAATNSYLTVADTAEHVGQSAFFDVLTDDENHNGLPDSWELQYFGSLNASGGGPNDDPDGDGFTNLQEYRAGLNPLVFDPLQFTQARIVPGIGIRLSVLGNLGNSYALLASTNLSDWTAILKFTCTNVPVVVTDASISNTAVRFYRVAPISAVPGPNLRFQSPVNSGTNLITLALDGVPGFNYRVDASSNLVNWSLFTNIISITPTMLFQDLPTAGQPSKYYRAVIQ